MVALVALIVSVVGVDAVLHPTSVVLDATVAGNPGKLTIDAPTLAGMLDYEVTHICATPSLLAPPEIRAGDNKGIGMALAEAADLGSVALALQAQLGERPEHIKLTLIGEDGAIKMLVSGSGLGGRKITPPFQQELVMQQGESTAAFVHRGALLGMQQIDPYTTSLYLVRTHLEDGNFTSAEALINATKADLPQTPVSFDRSMYENLQGIIELARGNLDKAGSWFRTAVTSDSDDAAPALNAGFVDVQLGNYQHAQHELEALLADDTTMNNTLRATAYMTLGVALMGQGQAGAADAQLAQAVQSDPSIAPAYGLWSDIKRAEGDGADADKLHAQAWAAANHSQIYAEVAALYLKMPWQPGKPITPSPFINPAMIHFND